MVPEIILASASPRRKALLERLVRDFKVMPSRIDEAMDCANSPEDVAVTNAHLKALDISKDNPDSLVIGADTVVVLNGKMLGKPKDDAESVRMLESLSGNTHEVITGIALVSVNLSIRITGHESTRVRFRNLTEKQINDYVTQGNCLDKAGAYGIQDVGDTFVREVDGNIDNVMGLPMKLLENLLREVRIIPCSDKKV